MSVVKINGGMVVGLDAEEYGTKPKVKQPEPKTEYHTVIQDKPSDEIITRKAGRPKKA